MDKVYYSTRNIGEKVSFAQGVKKGIASDGGLYVPEKFDTIDIRNEKYLKYTYQEMAVEVLSYFLNDFTREEVERCVYEAYGDKFEDKEIVPLKKFGNIGVLELFKGPTLAFKDIALSILPKFMREAKKKSGERDETVILTSTSGDTGKAALEGFADNDGIKIIVFFPTDGVSDIQKAQMITQEGENTHVVAIKGNFDDAQSGMKVILNDNEFKGRLEANGYSFSSANSINIGRLVPQIVYYFYGYFNLVKAGKISVGENINVVVPTGNFGNILASYYAYKMGLPVNRFVCASNVNNVLTDFINTGIYDINRKFETTITPSMDILISSNLERFIETLSNKNDKLIDRLMSDLKEKGRYELPQELKVKLNNFYAGFTTDEETKSVIRDVYDKYSYVIDPHTAVAYKVYEDYIKATGDNNTKTLITATASPYKFTRSVVEAISGESNKDKTDFELAEEHYKLTGIAIPKSIDKLEQKEVKHKSIIDVDKMKESVAEFLKI